MNRLVRRIFIRKAPTSAFKYQFKNYHNDYYADIQQQRLAKQSDSPLNSAEEDSDLMSYIVASGMVLLTTAVTISTVLLIQTNDNAGKYF
jgi:hypothetical protein